ncbi:hypothetical protein CQW23_03577 [Capsicum baccatum]|uniref:DNA topoisomerase n=1 Tax=Capsicum baccatum TaxID=33114 RepID=A0A2G2XCL5_CAPBA|nr:hypothetical protein CQW23_03577 [Capsicum baccatum]
MVEESTVLDSLLLPKKIFCLAEPKRDEALAVDARQEIDLKVGVACTRFQTSYFNRKYGNLDARKLFRQSLMANDMLLPCVKTQILSSISIHNHFLVASSALGFGPQLTKQLVERVCTLKGHSKVMDRLPREPGILDLQFESAHLHFVQFLICNFLSVNSYGTLHVLIDSMVSPSSFDLRGTLGALLHNPVDGDHPPITPMCSASLGNDAWKLYQYICQHFLGTLSPDCKYRRIRVEFESGKEQFQCVGQLATVKGFTSIMPWLAISEKNLPEFAVGEKV